MNAEIFAALAQLEKERGIPQSYMIEKITQALVAAYKKDKDGYTDNVFVEVKDDDMHMYVQKEVVDDVITPATEITLDAARKISKTAQLGDLVNVDVQTKAFGRIAAQTAKQVIIQGIREAERGMVFDTFSSKEHEILTGTVLRIEPATNDMTIRIGGGNDKTDAMLSASEQVRTEYYHEGDLIRVYVVEVRRSTRGPQVIVSRTHPGLVKRLFELEVPEIASGLVEIKSIAREAGSRTKIAVFASQDGIDPVGACVGTRGARVGAVVNELHGEKMDIIVWSEDPAKFVASALSPADVKSVTVLPGSTKACRVIVPDDQLSLAIGKEGQNARLAAKLTGCKIDINDDGNIFIASSDIEACRAARKTIEDIVFEPEIGALYYGKVSNIRSDFGAWVELAPGKDGLVKIKDLEFKRTEKVEDVLKVGDMTWVKVMNVGPKGIDLSRKDALRERGEA